VAFPLKDWSHTWFTVIPLPIEAEGYHQERDLEKASTEAAESSQVATIFANREHMVFVFHDNCSLWMKLYCLHIQLLSQRDSRPGRAHTPTFVTRGSL
jgi:hypothetical protein